MNSTALQRRLAAHSKIAIRDVAMISDDVFRARLIESITQLEVWAAGVRASAEIDITASADFWQMSVRPYAAGASPFDLLLSMKQEFSLRVGGETYEDKPIGRIDFFLMAVRAIAAGNVERVETRNALVGSLEKIEVRIELEDGWVWVGERRVGGRSAKKLEPSSERRVHRFLPFTR